MGVLFQWHTIIQRHHASLNQSFERQLEYSRFFETEGDSVFCQYTISKPDKPYILLLHGFGIDGRINFADHLDLFLAQYNVIIPDLSVFGKSKVLSNDYSVYTTARHIQLLLDLLKIPYASTYAIGLSYGTIVAAVLNGLLKGKLAGICLTASPVKFFHIANINHDDDPDEAYLKLAELLVPQSVSELNHLLEAASVRKYYIPKSIKLQMLNEFFLPNRIEKLKVLKQLINDRERLFEDDYGMREQSNILLISGDKDQLILKRNSDKIKQEIAPHAKYIIIPKQSHNIMSEAKTQWQKAVSTILMEWEAKRLS